MASGPTHGVFLAALFMLVHKHLSSSSSSLYAVTWHRYMWRHGLEKCHQNGMKYLDTRSPKAVENIRQYLGKFTTRQFWSSLRYDIREASFWWEGWEGTVNVTELQWANGQPDLSSKYECVTLILAGDVAVYEMSSCSNFSTVLCEGDELPQPASEKSSFRSFSKGNRQNGFCEPNQTGTPVCTFYHGLEEEVQLLEMCRVDVEEDCLLMCMGMSQCVHVVHTRSSTHRGTCLIHGKLIP